MTSANGVPTTHPDSNTARVGNVVSGQGGVTVNEDGSSSNRSSTKAKGADSFIHLATESTGLSVVEKVTSDVANGKRKRR